MDWKAEAMARLKKYDAMEQAEKNIPEELKRLEMEAESIRCALSDVAVRGAGPSRGDDRMINNMILRKELEWALEEAKIWLASTRRAMQALNDGEKLVLKRLYIYPEKGSISRLCEELGLEQSSVYRCRDKALHKFTIAMYGSVGG